MKKVLTNWRLYAIVSHACSTWQQANGGVAQLARAFGSYPKCHRFESSRRYHKLPPKREGVYILGALVKRSRHRPFTAVTRVRFPYASPDGGSVYGGLAQLVRAPASHAGGHWFESSSLHQNPLEPKGFGGFFYSVMAQKLFTTIRIWC